MPAAAQAVKLDGDEIRALLMGNTAFGRWEGANYRQWFGDDGATLYAQEGARTSRGEWRVDDVLEEYQSIWPRDADWEGWFVMEYGHTDYWVSRATPPTPFTGKAWWRSDQSCCNFAALLPIIAQANCDPLMMLKSENLSGDQPGLCLVSRTIEGPQTHATGPFGLGLMRQPYLRIV